MIKRIVGWFVLVPLCAVLIVFALANRQSVLVNFNPLIAPGETGPTSVAVPLYLVLFGTLLLGVILGGIAAWFAQGPHRRDEKHFRRETGSGASLAWQRRDRRRRVSRAQPQLT
jgi:uncharacterized integral membrane protein